MEKSPNIDFKISNLKLCICDLLPDAWKELKSKETLILKRWEKTSLQKLGTMNFNLLPWR
jgi:hypothetical protein